MTIPNINTNIDIKILAFETSCDDTCIGILHYKKKPQILVNTKIFHEKQCNLYGGVVPEVMARNHLENIDLVLQNALENSNLTMNDIDVVAVTVGPGLIGGLIVGYNFALALSSIYNKTFIPIHHLEGHILVSNTDFPFLALVVSGGHTLIVLCRDFLDYEVIANTLDDAAGEVFDKIGRMMGLPFPAGAHMSKIADDTEDSLPIPMQNKLQFSFSGLKTAFKTLLEKGEPKEKVAAMLQNTIALTLREKINLAVEKTGINKVVVCGGVASNIRIRKELDGAIFPDPALCVDNGIMIAYAASYHLKNNSKFLNNFNIQEFPRLSLSDWYKL